MAYADEQTGILNIDDRDTNWVKILFDEYVPPLNGETTSGILQAWQLFIKTYAIDPRDITQGFNFTGTPITGINKSKYDETDEAGFLEDKFNNLDGIEFEVTTGTSKVLGIRLSLKETASTTGAQSILSDSQTLKRIKALDDTIEVTSDDDYVYIRTNPDNFLKAVGEDMPFITSSTSYKSLELAGGMRSDGGNWEDDNFDPTMLTGRGTLPTNRTWASTSCRVAGFRDNGIDEVELIREYPHKGKINNVGETSVVMSFHGHLAIENTNTGNIRLGLEYFFELEGIAVTTSTIVYITVPAPTIAWAKESFEFPDIVVPDELGAQGHYRFWREGADALDTLSGYALISTIGYHYNIDSLGSDGVTTKTYE